MEFSFETVKYMLIFLMFYMVWQDINFIRQFIKIKRKEDNEEYESAGYKFFVWMAFFFFLAYNVIVVWVFYSLDKLYYI